MDRFVADIEHEITKYDADQPRWESILRWNVNCFELTSCKPASNRNCKLLYRLTLGYCYLIPSSTQNDTYARNLNSFLTYDATVNAIDAKIIARYTNIAFIFNLCIRSIMNGEKIKSCISTHRYHACDKH